MKSRFIFLTLVLSAVLSVLWLRFSKPAPNPAPVARSDEPAPPAALLSIPPTPPVATAPTTPRPLLLPPAPETLWEGPMPEPAFSRFAEWTHRYRSAGAEERPGLEAEGGALARARLAAMAEMIPSNPQRALELGVPFEVREAMPASVKAHLEEPLNTRGDLAVIAAISDSPSDLLPPVMRQVTIRGRDYQTFTHGRGLEFLTKPNVPLHGLAVPNIAAKPFRTVFGQPEKLLALSESPVRLLGRAEIAARQTARVRAHAADPICAVSQKPVLWQNEETVLELGGEIHSFCGRIDAAWWAEAQVQAAGLDLPTPNSPLPTAESSYTEGRKRMLCLRPYWTNYAGMTTNEALSHWSSFSNYMHQMSQGKLVFAPLGRGSDISPEIYLAGSVDDYTSGLGSAPSVWGAVRTAASAPPYNYVLGDYDFVYYCTKGKPSASYAGLGFVGGVGFHLANGYFDSAVSSHEFGHNLGLNHAHFWDTARASIIGSGQNVEYGDSNDPMGGGGSPNQYNSRYKNYLGWILNSGIADLNATGSGLYRLYAFDLDSSTGLQGLKFTYSGSQNYWLNFRQRKSGKALQNGAQLLWTGNGNQGSYLLDVRLKGDSSDNAIVIGRTFSDPSRGFHVTPVGKGNTFPESLDVRVNLGSFPGNFPPTLTLTAGSTNADLAQAISFAATANDPNGDPVAYFWDFGDGDYSTDNQAATAHTFAAEGEYAVQCTASDMKGGATRRTMIVRIGNPSTFRLSGRVLDAQNRPLAGIRVSANTGARAFTDSDGSYTLVGLAAGSHTVAAAETLSGSLSFAHPFFNNPVTVGPNFTSADFIGVVGSLDIYTPISAKGASWRYLDNGTDQGTAWRANLFNDSGWSNGVAPLGYPSGSSINTVVSFGPNSNNKYITSYARRSFVVPDPAAFTNLLLETLRDDGVIVFLNGAEVFRSNMPTGAVTSATTAIDSVEPDSYLQTTLSRTLLVPGTNYLAAEVHQVEVTSSDIAIDVALSGLSVSNASGFSMVYVSAPADQSTFPSGASVLLNATALSGGGAATNVEFYVDGAKVGEDATAPFSFLLDNPANGLHSLLAVGSFGATRSTSAPVAITVSAPDTNPPPVPLAFVVPGASWKYLAGPTAAPPAWASLGFNDAAWPSGPAPLGYGETGLGTTVPFGGNANNKWITTYFRRALTVNDSGAVSNLVVRLRRDDGGIVYLNGTEIFRSNITNGPVNYATLAFSAADETSYFSSRVPPGLLQPGTNVIAVEIHQAGITSSDLSFDLGCEGIAATNRPRGVYLVAPAAGAIVPLPDSITLTADVVAGGTLGVGKVEFFADGLKIGEDLSAPYSLTWSNPPAGSHTLTALATDTAAAGVTSAPVNISVLPPPFGTAFISFGDVWKYLDDGANAGSAWTARTFNDSSWMAGPARFGYGADGELTTVSFGTNTNNKHITTYFRRAFTVTAPGAFNALLLRLLRDDGAAVYLNGSEVYRNNLQPGLVSWNSLASATVDGALEQTPLDVRLPTTGLLSGVNVLAVEIHQASASSSDLGFDLALTGLDDTNTAQGIYLTAPAHGAHFNQPANVAFASFAIAPSPVTLVEYFNGTTKIGQAAASPYGFSWNGAPAGTHPITARATYGAGLMLTSPPITIAVGPPPPPIVPVFTTLLPPAAGAWKYWDSSTNVSSGWQSPSFDDGAWLSGSARFGWGFDGEMTPLSEGRITHYFRRWFTLANGGMLSELLFELVRDDGAVVYLNGVEVFRSNMPPGPVAPATLASASVNTPEETTWFETALATSGSGLSSGSNLVAIELHQSSATSSDASFDFALYGQGTTERRVYVSSPTHGASYQNTAVIPLEALAQAGAGLSVTKVEFLVDGVKVGESMASPYRLAWSGASFGPHTINARLTDNTGGVSESAPVAINLTRELITTTFIPSNSVWRYLDTGVNQGTAWTNLNFNDSTWPSGPARLGFGGDGEITLLNGGPSNARYPTFYFRHKFVVAQGEVYTNLLFKLARDDGAVVHLNGREAFRSNMPLGPISFTTLATNATDEQTFFPTTVVVTNLAPGTNVVAVEVHQSSATSGDLGFNLELTANGYLENTTPPQLDVEFTDGLVEISWPAAGTWQLYAAPSVAPSGPWTLVTTNIVTVGGRKKATIAPTEEKQFFRLERP